MKLSTIDEHNEDILRRNNTHLTGVSCPNCGNELQFAGDERYLTYPMQAVVRCYKCNYTGKIYV